jgi:hypothetical protein
MVLYEGMKQARKLTEKRKRKQQGTGEMKE